MEIIIAETAGFCFGVNRAMNIIEESIKGRQKIVTLGPIIHNPDIVRDLSENGVDIIDAPGKVPGKEYAIVIRSHGVKKEIYDKIKDLGNNLIDATCPYVKKIHHIVEKYRKMDYNVVIVGDFNHPEVEGIIGWCNDDAQVVSDVLEAKRAFEKFDKICLVSQTTFSSHKWQDIVKAAHTINKEILVFNTICSATNDRQKEAVELAKTVDAMIVIGGKESSNTTRLFMECSKYCKNTYHIENKSQLFAVPVGLNKVGITAGASTPAYIIKEVVKQMEEREVIKEVNFEEAMEQTLKHLHTGDVVMGSVFRVTPTEVYVNLNTKADGIIPADQLSVDPDVKPEDVVKVGDELECFVVRVNDVEGTITLSVRKLEAIKAQKELEEAYESKKVLKGKVQSVVNGGIIVISAGIRVFVPASQASDRYLSDLADLVGSEVSFKLIDFDKKKRKVVGSIKTVLLEEKKVKAEAFWEQAAIGNKYQGVVKSITGFGAFVDIGGVDGLVHINELSWKRIKSPSEVVKVGDIIEVFILDINKENSKISLGYRKQEDNPWENIKDKINKDDVIKAKIVRIVPFGAFAEIEKGVDGLIHISQISNKRIAKPEDVLSVGQEVEAKIVDIDWENQKIGLSIRELMEEIAPKAPVNEEQEEAEPSEYKEELIVTLADTMEIPTIEEDKE